MEKNGGLNLDLVNRKSEIINDLNNKNLIYKKPMLIVPTSIKILANMLNLEKWALRSAW